MSFNSFLDPVDNANIAVQEKEIYLKNKGNIDDILSIINIDEDVKNLAEKYYYMLTVNTTKTESKIRALYYCTLVAQEVLCDEDKGCPSEELAVAFYLTPKQCKSAVKDFHGRLTIDRPITGYVSIETCIRNRARSIWDKDVVEDIIREWRQISGFRPDLENMQPSRIVPAFLYYYINSRGYTVTIEEMLNKFKNIKKEHLLDTERVINDIVSTMRTQQFTEFQTRF